MLSGLIYGEGKKESKERQQGQLQSLVKVFKVEDEATEGRRLEREKALFPTPPPERAKQETGTHQVSRLCSLPSNQGLTGLTLPASDASSEQVATRPSTEGHLEFPVLIL